MATMTAHPLLAALAAARPSRDEGSRMDLWADLDEEILACLDAGAPATPAEIGRRLGVSEAAAASCLSMLAGEGKVRICLVERARVPVAQA
jgi:hypothetical protein